MSSASMHPHGNYGKLPPSVALRAEGSTLHAAQPRERVQRVDSSQQSCAKASDCCFTTLSTGVSSALSTLAQQLTGWALH